MFIHRRCLDEYIQHYPSRRCTVCHAYFRGLDTYETAAQVLLAMTFAGTLLQSDAHWMVKLMWFLWMSLFTVGLYTINQLTTTCCLLSSLIYVVTCLNPMTIFICIAIALIHTHVTLVPPDILFVLVVTCFVSFYTGLFMFAVLTVLDVFFCSLLFVFLFQIWYLSVGIAVRTF